MFNLRRKKSINQINMYAIFFAGVFAFVAAFIVIFNEYLDFNKEIAKFEKNYIDIKKREIVKKSDRLRKIIEYNYKRSKNSQVLRKNIVDMSENILLDEKNRVKYFIFKRDMGMFYCSGKTKFCDRVKKRLREDRDNSYKFFNFTYEKDKYLAFSRAFEELDMIYGSMIVVDGLDNELKNKQIEYKNKISGFILKIFSLTLVLYIISILKYRYFTEKISSELKYMIKALDDTSLIYKHIDLEEIEFEEFSQIALHVNKMIDKIKTKNRELVSLNMDLERLVQDKTDELQKSIEYTKELLKYQDKFVKNAIHEINTPLSIILINIELYNMKYEKNSYLTKIEAAVKVLENIYGDLSYIVKKDRLVHKKEMIDFSSYLKERVEYFGDVARGNDLNIKAKIEDGIFVFFSEIQLQRLCDNNISNAIKYSYPKKSIDIKLFIENSSVVLEVANYGDKIQDSSKLFDRFYREDIARGGFGLGLNIVKEICDINYITVEVSSIDNLTKFRYIFSGELY